MAKENLTGTSYNTGLPSASMSDTEALRARIRTNGSIYDIAFNTADPQQFAATASKYFDGLSKTKNYTTDPGLNDLQYLQAVVRKMKLSKGTSNLGDMSLEDYSAIQKVFQTSYLRGYEWDTVLENDYNSPYRTGGSAFSKDVSTAIKMIDKSDSENILSKAYYTTFGRYPSSKQIETFKTKYNLEAQRQAQVITTTKGGEDITSSKSISKNQGFTQEEQDQFLAKFLKDNYKITGEEQSGYVKNVITNIKNAYANNLLPEEDMEETIKFAAGLVGTADDTMANQKLDAKLQSIRNVAAKLNPGIADILAAGQDASSVVDPIVKSINTALGTNFTKNDAQIKKVINFNDGKTTRVMNTSELNTFIEKLPEFQTSDVGRAKYLSIAEAVRNGLQ
jgi:hypothetical protein